jgi:hypothetical protein
VLIIAAILSYDLVIFSQASPAQFAKAGNWNAFAQQGRSA